jgi:dipeptide/tripeptide permease
MMPWLVERVGWEWAFAFLAPGPFLGIVAMMRLRRAGRQASGLWDVSPESRRLPDA